MRTQDQQMAGSCPECHQGSIQCSHNYFEEGDLRIASWEHRCNECGFRETTAIRSDELEEKEKANFDLCPFCQRRSERN